MIGTANQWQAFYPDPGRCSPTWSCSTTISPSIPSQRQGPALPRAGRLRIRGFLPALDRWLFFNVSAIRDAEGPVVGAIETLQDVSARKQAESPPRKPKASGAARASRPNSRPA